MREKISLKVEGTVKIFVCFTKRTENVTLEMFSRQGQRKKSVEVRGALSPRGGLCLVESLGSCSCGEIAVSQIWQGRASLQQRAAWAPQS